MANSASVISRYGDPRDEIVAPHHRVQLSHYYVDNWIPRLGERGRVIVTVPRRLGYLDRKKGVVRDGIEIDQADLARLCGLTLRTLQREFGGGEGGAPVNPALHRFVQREKQCHRNSAGRIIREKTVYIVQMRDPLVDEDLEKLAEGLGRREKGRSRQIGGEAGQLGGNNKEDSDSYRLLKNLNTSAAGESLALFSEGEESVTDGGLPPKGSPLVRLREFFDVMPPGNRAALERRPESASVIARMAEILRGRDEVGRSAAAARRLWVSPCLSVTGPSGRRIGRGGVPAPA